MKKYYFITDTFKNRMIISIVAITMLFIFNFWFSYKDQIPLKAALAAQTFYIDNQLSAECLNYVVASRSCGTSSGIHAWHDLSDGLKAIDDLQSSTIELGGHTIYIRAGTYYDRVTEWPSGGSNDKRNIIKGYNNEIPVISGAKILTSWQDQGGDIYSSADITSVNRYFDLRDIYQDNIRLTEAEHPNSGAYFTIDARGDGTYIEDAELIALYNQDPDLVIDATVEFVGRDLYGERFKIQSVDLQTGRAYFYSNNVIGAAPYPNAIYHLVGKIEYLDQAGEYYYQINESTDFGEIVYVKFSINDQPNNHLLEIPDQEVFRFGYGASRPAFYLNISNLELRHGTQSVNFDGDRAQIVNFGNDFVHNITMDNVDAHDNARFGYVINANAHHIVVKNSTIENNNLAGIYANGFAKPVCGNGVKENWTIGSEYTTQPEQCDDGNLVDGDGCSAMCGLSGGYDGRAVEPWDDYYKAYFTIDNNTIKNNKSNGISLNYLAESIVSNNTLEYNGAHSANSGMGFQRGSDNKIFGNSISYQGGNGILLEGGDDKLKRFEVYDNLVHYSSYNNDPHISAYFAIWLDEADNNLVYDNTFYNENGRGLAIGGANDNKIIYNKFLDIFSAIDDSENRKAEAAYIYHGASESLNNNIIAHNVFAGKFILGFDFAAPTGPDGISGNIIANNILYSTRSDEVRMIDFSTVVNHSLNTYNNNLYYAPNTSQITYSFEGVEYPSLAAFRTASSNQESSSLNTNPLFTNFASNNFNLQSNSPAIDSAMTLAGINNTTYEGQGPDIGLLEYASGPTCGNYLTESGEQCDDGDTTSGDGCSSSCQTEVAPENGQGGEEGGTPPPPPETPPITCGNNIQESGEQCDDGNTTSNDGCSYLCQLEDDTPTSTTPILEIDKLQGTLVKTNLDSKVYYINSNNQRYLIPNLNTFKSWFKNFSNLAVITPQALASYPYLGRLTIKPGNLVVFQNSNKVYVVEPEKTLRWIKTGNVFKEFGYDFKKIITLPQEDFQYYTQGEDITDSSIHPTGQLLKHGNFAPIFYIKDNIEYWVKDEATFLSLGFKWQDIITIPVRYWYTRVLDNFSFRLRDR